MKRLLVLGALLASVTACDEAISRGWLVDRTRVLGVRVEAANDPARATLVPGEAANVKWLIASPGPRPNLSFAWALCASPTGTYPTPRCEGPLLAAETGNGGGEDVVSMTVPAPPAGTIGDAAEVLLLAAFCADGTPTLDARAFTATCAHGAPLLASTTLRVGAPNVNPTIADGDLLLDGAPLAPSSVSVANVPCTDAPDAVVVAPGGEHPLVFRFRDDQREIAPEVRDGKEALIVSHVVTSGELDRQYSAFDAVEAAPKEVTITWTTPPAAQVPPAGQLVQLFFVLRDGRGGTAFARRAVCVRPL